ncbi:MAG: metal ABC transporter permease [Candidatus Aminicenantes bacterium]|jgi:zinc transport system permease protein|nr:metal ABC transporter permease [Candidatus Aminicenantes bacterium]
MNSILVSSFFWRAILAGSFLALACGLLGVFLVLRRDAMIAHGLSHVAFAGVAIGLLLNVLPLIVSLIVCILGSFFILKLKNQAKMPGDTAIAILSSAGMALGIFLTSFKRGFGAELMTYLFGDVLAIAPMEVWLAVGLAFLVIVLLIVNYYPLIFSTFDRESALVSGIRVQRLEEMLIFLSSITVVLGIRIVGLLLVTALTVLPAASSLQLARNFKSTLILSSIFSLFSIISGILLAYIFDLSASAAIVFISIFIFLICLALKKINLVKSS